ncbi:hypothetical protein BJY52DRAFT_1417175 [Lactarius psammicola]|nr:hypothetical protein BJY52DRAFT_1417175 [Lactarius psammicola]
MLRKDDPDYPIPDGFLCSQFILPIVKSFITLLKKDFYQILDQISHQVSNFLGHKTEKDSFAKLPMLLPILHIGCTACAAGRGSPTQMGVPIQPMQAHTTSTTSTPIVFGNALTLARLIYFVDRNTRAATWKDPQLPLTVDEDALQYKRDYRRKIVYFRSQLAMRLIANTNCDVHVRCGRDLRGQLHGDHASPVGGPPQAAHSQV